MHANAAGFGIKNDNIEAFINYANNELKDIDFNEGVYEVDFIRSQDDSDLPELVLELGSSAELWAQGNTEPFIVVENITLSPDDIYFMGANKDSVKFNVGGVDFCKFKDAEFVMQLKSMKEINMTIIGRANINHYMGQTSPQVFIDDYDIHDSYFEF